MVRPLSRKDIFYSGSVTNLKEYQSQKSLTDYRNSVVSLTRFEKEHRNDVPRYQDPESSPADPCPCINLPPAFKAALSSMLDVTLLKDPAFMLIGISNLFGMAALYIPFFYLVDAATKNVSPVALSLRQIWHETFFLAGYWRVESLVLAVNYRNHQHIRSYHFWLRGWLPIGRCLVHEQCLSRCVYNISWIDTLLCLILFVHHYGAVLRSRDW